MNEGIKNPINNEMKLIFIAIILIMMGLLLSRVESTLGFIPKVFIYMGLYVFYKYILELTTKTPIPHPNLYKVLISLILSITFIIVLTGICAAWTQSNIFYGMGSNPKALVEAIIKLIDYFINMSQ